MNLRRYVLRVATLAMLVIGLGVVAVAGKITVDPNTGGVISPKTVAAVDPRLAQKVTYQAQYRAVHEIVSDLAEITGVKLITGASKTDWPVRDRKMNIFVKDVTLADLMNSIAHTMKFHWTRSEKLDPPVYRLIVDRKAAIAADAQMARAKAGYEEIWQTRRDEWIDAIMEYGAKPPSEIESLRQTNPVVYRYARYGVAQALRALFVEVPEAKNRFKAGRGFRISADKLNTQTADLLFAAGNGYWKYLETAGYFGTPSAEPGGYGDVLKREDKFDIAYFRMDEMGGFTPGLRWGGTTQLSSGYFHLMKNGRDFEMADLRAINEDWSRCLCESNNQVLDKQAPSGNDDGIDHYKKLMKSLEEQEESLYPSEPLNEHPEFPELADTIKLKIEAPKTRQDPVLATNNYIASLQGALADATGIGVVSDSWVNISGDKLPEEETKLGELLDEFSKRFNYNWDKHSTILEFRHRKWWKNRLNQISDDLVATWSENTRKNGVLSLDDLAQVSTLVYEQAEESVKSDPVLGAAGLYRQIVTTLDRNGNLHWLRLYDSLSPSLRSLLCGETGVNGFMLTQDQWKLAQTMFDRIDSSRGDALFRIETVPNPDTTVYWFKEIDTDTDEQDRVWDVPLPRYTPPPDTLETKQEPPTAPSS